MAPEDILKNIVRVGTVTDVNNSTRKARVRFHDVSITSDWLYVLNNRPYIPDYKGPQRTETAEGGSGDQAYESHKHDLIIKPWMPKIDDVVVCLYLPVFNADGFVLGGIGA